MAKVSLRSYLVVHVINCGEVLPTDSREHSPVAFVPVNTAGLQGYFKLQPNAYINKHQQTS